MSDQGLTAPTRDVLVVATGRTTDQDMGDLASALWLNGTPVVVTLGSWAVAVDSTPEDVTAFLTEVSGEFLVNPGLAELAGWDEDSLDLFNAWWATASDDLVVTESGGVRPDDGSSFADLGGCQQ